MVEALNHLVSRLNLYFHPIECEVQKYKGKCMDFALYLLSAYYIC